MNIENQNTVNQVSKEITEIHRQFRQGEIKSVTHGDMPLDLIKRGLQADACQPFGELNGWTRICHFEQL